MAETISSAASSMELALKDSSPSVAVGGGLLVDMTPTTAALLHHNAMALRSLKEAAAHRDASVSGSGSASESELPEPRSPTPTPTNLSTGGPHSPPMTFRCERCDNFETSSRATLLLHVVQCLAGQAAAAAAAASVRLKSEDLGEPENMSLSHMDTGKPSSDNVGGSSSSASSSPAGNGSGNSSSSRKVFECDVCNMKFSNGANMRRHKMRHTGVKPYECRVCQKRFFRKDHLAEHFTTHTKTLPYHCPICNRGFQRQIAMRAHFQNEHVGQHDLVKTCPLCSYRAGSMKSLRIHFFNRHGIDLDNPGPGGTSSLLLALESQASAAAAAAAASYVPPGMSPVPVPVTAQQQQQQQQSSSVAPPPASHQSDSGESMRSLENATPPMHFLTPHVEISTLSENGNTELFNLICVWRESALQGNNNNNNNNSNNCTSSSNANTNIINNNNNNCNSHNNNTISVISNGNSESNVDKVKDRALIMQSPVELQLPMDCNTKATPITSSTTTTVSLKSHLQQQQQQHHHHHHHENHITPSISLIPIKQEPMTEDVDKKLQISGSDPSSDTEQSSNHSSSTNHNNRTSLIKVSPLKSLLREDLKRRICAKANNRITRNATPLDSNSVLSNSLSNGSGPGSASGGVNSSSNGGGTAASAVPNPSNGSGSTQICNGTITSTGQDGDLLNRKLILTCHFCGIEFPDETLYFLHKGCHCESNPWKCNICGEQLNNVYDFNAHLLSKSHQ
ncbi:uncharacterized protein DMAD_03954 [Drosophila madeirensis]|uniref:C2H2-type domain-containing protein n=1 Tax=Drosophila madeirensis TaxID=30013 RepID=A0AAU9G961_DROMD